MVVLRRAWKLFQSVGDIDESIRFDLGGKVTFVLVPLELSAKILDKRDGCFTLCLETISIGR